MRKGDVFEGKVLRMDFPNKGIIEAEGERIVVKNALPGQKIQGVLTKKRKGACEGRLLAVLEPSPVEDGRQACPHSGLCGGWGCGWPPIRRGPRMCGPRRLSS